PPPPAASCSAMCVPPDCPQPPDGWSAYLFVLVWDQSRFATRSRPGRGERPWWRSCATALFRHGVDLPPRSPGRHAGPVHGRRRRGAGRVRTCPGTDPRAVAGGNCATGRTVGRRPLGRASGSSRQTGHPPSCAAPLTPPRDPVDQPPELISVIELSWISMPFGSFNVAIRPNGVSVGGFTDCAPDA